MTQYGSLVPEVKDALVTVLNARAGLSGITTSRETPDEYRDYTTPSGAGEAIWIGREGGQDVDIAAPTGPAMGGRLDPDEAFTVWLTISVLFDNTSGVERTAQNRAYEIMGEVLGCVFAAPSLGITVNSAARGWKGVMSHSAQEVNRRLKSSGYWCRIELGLDCFGRLTLT